jgi:hypothetical protein
MKLGVIGEPCMDYIHRPRVPAEKKLGGILYSVVSLAAISAKDDEIYPVMNLGEDEFDYVLSFLAKFPHIKTEFINKTPVNTRVVNLYYKDKTGQFLNPETGKLKTYDREENSTKPTPPLEFYLVKDLLPSLDGMLINLVSGVDISLQTLIKLRENFKGYMHMDLHNLVMTTHEDGTRTQGFVSNWLDWCHQTDTLQMNESELGILPGEKMHEYETAEKILSDSIVKALVVTRGKLGVSLYFRKETEAAGEKYFELDKIDLPAIETPHFVDSTGCGDVFAAAFFYMNAVHSTIDFHNSLNFANKIASRSSELFGVEELISLG